MQEIFQIIQFAQNYLTAMQTGLNKTVSMLPGLIEQEVEVKAKQKLHTSMQNYIDAFSSNIENYVVIMELDEDNWLACAVERGISSFDMKQGFFKGKNVKTSAKGYRYVTIPMGKQVGGKAGPSEKSKKIQEKINAVMKKPQIISKYGQKSKLYTQMGGKFVPGVFPGGPITENQQINVGGDPDISGLYRTRTFSNAEEYSHKQKVGFKGSSWNLVMFRVASEDPRYSDKFIHPGITGVHILQDTNEWLTQVIGKLLDTNIKKEIEKIK